MSSPHPDQTTEVESTAHVILLLAAVVLAALSSILFSLFEGSRPLQPWRWQPPLVTGFALVIAWKLSGLHVATRVATLAGLGISLYWVTMGALGGWQFVIGSSPTSSRFVLWAQIMGPVIALQGILYLAALAVALMHLPRKCGYCDLRGCVGQQLMGCLLIATGLQIAAIGGWLNDPRAAIESHMSATHHTVSPWQRGHYIAMLAVEILWCVTLVASGARVLLDYSAPAGLSRQIRRGAIFALAWIGSAGLEATCVATGSYTSWVSDMSSAALLGLRSSSRLMPVAMSLVLWAVWRRILLPRVRLAQCVKCGYPRAGATSARCPECGATWEQRVPTAAG